MRLRLTCLRLVESLRRLRVTRIAAGGAVIVALSSCSPDFTRPVQRTLSSEVRAEIGRDYCTEIWIYYPAYAFWLNAGSDEMTDIDPYVQCNGDYDALWGNNYGDGRGFMAWDEIAAPGEDDFDVAAREQSACPMCPILVIAARLLQNPRFTEWADEIGENALGLANRIIVALNRVGPASMGQFHHIATIRNSLASWSGGPWTPKFMQLFSRAGMSLSDPLNRVYIVNHTGPHSAAYHAEVFRRLTAAVGELTGNAARDAIELELARMLIDLTTPGSYLWQLLQYW